MNLKNEKKNPEMPENWIENRIDEASKIAPIPNPVISIIKDQLNGKIREGTLLSSELDNIAKTLLKAMNDISLEGTPQ